MKINIFAHMESYEIERRLEAKNIKPTTNRILVMKAILSSGQAVSLSELEQLLETMDKSSIFRTLSLFLDHHAVHGIYDGSGCMKYEACNSPGSCLSGDGDIHAHFYCRSCHRTICLKGLSVPELALPSGFRSEYINYTVVGLCEKCSVKGLGAGD